MSNNGTSRPNTVFRYSRAVSQDIEAEFLRWTVGAADSASAAKLAASTLAAMNPHYHPYGGPELASPHPPSPDNNNYHGHGGPGGPHGHGGHMHPTNGHGIGPLGEFESVSTCESGTAPLR